MPNFIDADMETVEKIARVAPTKTVGFPGTTIWNGYIQESENNSKLTGSEKYKTYANILANVSIVAAGVRYFLNLISNSDWTIEPADENNPLAVRYAEEIESAKDNLRIPWRRVIRKSATFKFYGFSLQEWTARRNANGLIAIHRIDVRPQVTIEQWFRDQFGDVDFVVQRRPENFESVEIPRSKLIYMVDDALNDSPEGLGLFRHLAEPARRLQRFEMLEGYGFETDLRGIPVGRGPFSELQQLVNSGEISSQDKENAIKPLKSFITGHIKNPQLGLLLDSITYQTQDDAGSPSNVRQWDMELLSSSANSQPDVANTILRLNGEIARILSMEGLLLGSTPNGSRSLDESKTKNLAMVVESTQKEIAETYDKDFIGVMGELNGWDPELWPKAKPEPIRFKDITEITQAINDLAGAGAILAPDDPVIDAVRDLLSMPKQSLNFPVDDASLTGNGSNTSNRNDNTEDIDGSATT